MMNTPLSFLGRVAAILSSVAVLALPVLAQAQQANEPCILVEHAPNLNGRVEGSVQINLPESFNLNRGCIITGSLMVPGNPEIQAPGQELNVTPEMDEPIEQGHDYRIHFNRGVEVGEVRLQSSVRLLDPVRPWVDAQGSESVILDKPEDAVEDFSVVRNLIVNGSGSRVEVPAGSYGSFICNGDTTLVLEGGVYFFENLLLNGNSRLETQGSVVIVLGQDLNLNRGDMGSPGNPDGLTVELPHSGANIGGDARFFGHLRVPHGHVNLNSGCEFEGSIQCQRLNLNSGVTVRGR